MRPGSSLDGRSVPLAVLGAGLIDGLNPCAFATLVFFISYLAFTGRFHRYSLRNQLLIGWGMGTAVTVIGLYLSYAIDLPSGPTVVVFYGVALALGAALVAGLAYSTADTTNLIPFDAEIGLLVFLVTAAYGLGIFLGYRRYR